ncbi:cellulose synthase complex periplasmic endoglucanase BcsZ [Thiolapillus sp.]
MIRQALACSWLLLAWAATATAATCPPWPLWQSFQRHLISEDGRVIDFHTPAQYTTSEGQSYALFMALVDNDQTRFDQLLRWTENNLAHGSLAAHLPAWQWGRKENGDWGVVDANSASDADLWIAYSLAEAGRLWHRPHLTSMAKSLARRILKEESKRLPGLGLMLLPGKQGFSLQPGRWRLNPSYLPPQLLRRMEELQPGLGWQEMLENTVTMLRASDSGFIPDWIIYDAQLGFLPDEAHDAIGSYGAIRSYLWVGMLSPDDPLRQPLLQLIRPMAERALQLEAPPRSINTKSGQSTGLGPPGFSASLMPLFKALGHPRGLALLRDQAQQVLQHPNHYYDQVLALFALGWMEGRYRFSHDGKLQPRWKASCTENTKQS